MERKLKENTELKNSETSTIQFEATEPKFMDIWFADMVDSHDSITTGRRPVIVVSNDVANARSPVITIVPVTTKIKTLYMPTHVCLGSETLPRESMALCENITAISKSRLVNKVAEIREPKSIRSLQKAISAQLNMRNFSPK